MRGGFSGEGGGVGGVDEGATSTSSAMAKAQGAPDEAEGVEDELLGKPTLTPELEDLWDTRSLYASQLSMEDLVWTDWFGGTEEDATFEEALLGKKAGRGKTLSSRSSEDASGLDALSSNEMAKRVLRRTSKGKHRECVGTSLFKSGSVGISLWCDPESTEKAMREEYGMGKHNPTLLFSGKSDAFHVHPRDFVLHHAGELGLAVSATTTKPVAYRDLKRAITDVVGPQGSQSLAGAFEKLESSDVLYEGLLGIALPRVLFHEPKHGTVDLEQSGEASWKFPALVKIEDACIAASRGLRRSLIRCQQEYVKVGAEVVFDYKKSEPSDLLPSDYDVFGKLGNTEGFESIQEYRQFLGEYEQIKNPSQSQAVPLAVTESKEDTVDVMVVTPANIYGKRSSIHLGTFGMDAVGRPLLCSSVLDVKDETLMTHKNYPLLGLSYVANGFKGISWRQKLPRWRRALRTSGTRFKSAVDNFISKGFATDGGSAAIAGDESSGRRKQQQDHLDTLEVINGECMAGMYYVKTNFECYDLRAGNPIPMVLHSVHTRTLGMRRRQKKRQCVYQLQ